MDNTSLASQGAVLEKVSKVTAGLQVYEEKLKCEHARLHGLNEALEHQREELVKERIDLEKQRKELAESQQKVARQRVQLEAETAAARKLRVQAESDVAEGKELKTSLSDLSKWIQQQKMSVEEERKRLLHEKEGFLKGAKERHVSRDGYESDVTLQGMVSVVGTADRSDASVDTAAAANEPPSTRFSMTGCHITFAQDRTLSDHVLTQVKTLVSQQDDRLDDTVSFLNTFLAVNISKVGRTNVTRIMNELQVARKRMWSEFEAIKKDFAVDASGSTWSGTKFTNAANTHVTKSQI